MKYMFYKAFVLFLICGFFSLAGLAQNANSSIKGTVTDTHGAVVSGATVTLSNVGTNQSLSTTSNADGFYTFVNLAPANYKLSVSASGFADWVGVLTLAGFASRAGGCDDERCHCVDSGYGQGRHSCHRFGEPYYFRREKLHCDRNDSSGESKHPECSGL